jgi:hypothetical protein
MTTQSLHDWQDRFSDLIDAARHADDMDETDRDRLIHFVTTEVARICGPNREYADPWRDLGYMRCSLTATGFETRGLSRALVLCGE